MLDGIQLCWMGSGYAGWKGFSAAFSEELRRLLEMASGVVLLAFYTKARCSPRLIAGRVSLAPHDGAVSL